MVSVRFKEDDSDTSIETWLKICAGLMPRLTLTNPLPPGLWIARLRLMLTEVPAVIPALRQHADSLIGRFPEATGLSFKEVTAIVQLLNLWMLTVDLNTLLQQPDSIRLDPGTWLQNTTISSDAFRAFLDRTARGWDSSLSDEELGGPLSTLPFRDRPFLRLSNGTVTPVMRELVSDKLTSDVFWWLKNPDIPQDVLWQRDWGYLAEGYLSILLARLAEEHGCDYRADVKWDGNQLDAAMWHEGHVALFEFTTCCRSLKTDQGNAVLLTEN